MKRILLFLLLNIWRYFISACVGLAWVGLIVAIDRSHFQFILQPVNLPISWLFGTIVFCVLQDQYERVQKKYKKM